MTERKIRHDMPAEITIDESVDHDNINGEEDDNEREISIMRETRTSSSRLGREYRK